MLAINIAPTATLTTTVAVVITVLDTNAHSPVLGASTYAAVVAEDAAAATGVVTVLSTFRLNFHHFDRFELDLRGHAHVRGADFSCLRLKCADMVLI